MFFAKTNWELKSNAFVVLVSIIFLLLFYSLKAEIFQDGLRQARRFIYSGKVFSRVLRFYKQGQFFNAVSETCFIIPLEKFFHPRLQVVLCSDSLFTKSVPQDVIFA